MIKAQKKNGHIYTVSKLTREIKSLLEDRYPFIWVAGEISNYSVPGSGHSYFTLKDQTAVISAVMFKNQKRNLKFQPENGMNIFGLARLTLYEPRGSYQLIFEHLEPEGAGAMQVAFEQLKKKLSEMGFFDQSHKKQIPFLPSGITLITSATGAAIKDVINVAQRRFPDMRLDIFSVRVQGEESPQQICDAIQFANQINRSDVIILARGGGSLEDLAAFNTESVAHAVFNSCIPIVTGIGHETDFSIADFVADLRAPTPSAAAELAVPDKNKLLRDIVQLQERLDASFTKKKLHLESLIMDLTARLKSPETLMYDLRFKIDDYESRLTNIIHRTCKSKKDKWIWLTASLHSDTPTKKISEFRQQIRMLDKSLSNLINNTLRSYKTRHLNISSQLQVLNPEAVLQRGYSISRFASDKKVITDANRVKPDDLIEIVLSKGQLTAKVEKVNG